MLPVRSLLVLIFALALCRGLPAKDERASLWESAFARFEEQDRQSPPPEGGIVFVGSSSIRLWNLAESFPGLPAINRGFGGSQTVDSARNAERLVVKYKPRVVVFYAGDNDLASGKSPEQVRDDFATFLKQIRAGLPAAKLLYLSVKPSSSRWALYEKQQRVNELVRELIAGDPRAEFVDLATPLLGADGKPRDELFVADRLHLNKQGYEVWTAVLKPKLDQALAGSK